MDIFTNTEWSERAAMLEYEGGISRALAEAAAVVFCINPPHGIDTAAWQLMTNILGDGLDRHNHHQLSQE